MEYGFGIPTRGSLSEVTALSEVVTRGEQAGFDFIGVSDHIVIPNHIESRYPYSETGTFGGANAGECLEQLTLVAFLSAITTKIRLLTSVMVLPYRNPVHTAKTLATIDVLSGGRLIAGFGAGWMREEFEALGAPPYGKRGKVSDEFIEAFRELWTSESPVFSGEYVSFSGVKFRPQPVQDPYPPIWIGGESPAALRRAGRVADAWYPIGNNPKFPMTNVPQLREGMDTVRKYAELAGRDPMDVELSYSAGWYSDTGQELLSDGQRLLLTGSPVQVASDIEDLRQLGVRHLMIGIAGSSANEIISGIERFATKVRPLVSP